MKNLIFDYYMQIDYSEPVSKCNYTIKCIPKDNNRQKVGTLKIDMFPKSIYSEGKDGFKNKQIYGLNDVAHSTFFFRITGNVQTGLGDYEECYDEDLDMVFKHPHGLNVSGPCLKKYFKKLSLDLIFITDIYSKAIHIMNRLHDDYKYEKFVTNVNTSAEEAFSMGKGVCQDYAHILIALFHQAGISARYVTGLIIGEGESHGWVEFLYEGKWYGIDPTNNKVVTDEYIKIGVGRDASDCMINRGIMHGGGFHTQTIKVNVKEDI